MRLQAEAFDPGALLGEFRVVDRRALRRFGGVDLALPAGRGDAAAGDFARRVLRRRRGRGLLRVNLTDTQGAGQCERRC